jgi:transposase
MQLQQTLAKPKLYIGIDVHKKTWSAHYKTDICDHKTITMPPEPQLMADYVFTNFPNHEVQVAYEASCCGFSAARYFLNLAWNVLVVHVPDMPKTDKQNYQKTDKLDSRNICNWLATGQLKSVHIPTEQQEQFCNLLRQRFRVTKQLRNSKCNIKSALLYLGIAIPEHLDKPHWTKDFITWLQQLTFTDIAGKYSMESKLRAYTYQEQDYRLLATQLRAYAKIHYKKDYELLKTVPGVGGYMAAAILAELGDIRRFKNERQFSSYIGMVPGIHQSASTEKQMGITPRCRALIRTYLVQGAWQALRRDPELQAYYRTHVGKNVKSVIIKIAHKLVKRIYSVIKNETPYVCNYKNTNNTKLDKNLLDTIEQNINTEDYDIDIDTTLNQD